VGGMSKMRERMIGAFATVAVAGLVFTAVAVSNAQEPAPVADQEATIATLTARLDAVEDTLSDHGSRLTDAEWEILVHGMGLQNLSGWVIDLRAPPQ